MSNANAAQPCIGLIAGSGDLPYLVAVALHDKQHDIALFTIKGQRVDHSFDFVAHRFEGSFGAVQPALDFFKKHHVQTIVMAGGIQKPNFSSLSLDKKGMKWISHLGVNIFKADDALLTALIRLFESEGFKIEAPHFYVKDLMLKAGLYGHQSLSLIDQQDIDRGKAILRALSPYDVGQSIVVSSGNVLGIETIGGTENLLKNVQAFQNQQQFSCGFLIKCAKTSQTRLVDMPTIGPHTIDQVAEAGLKGLAIEAASVQVLHHQLVLDKIQSYGLLLVVF